MVFDGTQIVFITHLVSVLGQDGQETMVSFLERLHRSDFVGVEGKEQIAKILLTIKSLTPQAWIVQFCAPQSPPIRKFADLAL